MIKASYTFSSTKGNLRSTLGVMTSLCLFAVKISNHAEVNTAYHLAKLKHSPFSLFMCLWFQMWPHYVSFMLFLFFRSQKWRPSIINSTRTWSHGWVPEVSQHLASETCFKLSFGSSLNFKPSITEREQHIFKSLILFFFILDNSGAASHD